MPATLRRLNLSKAKILVVEDSVQSMEILSQVLLGFGVTQPRKCTSVDTARKAIEGTFFDLVLIDQDMPEGSGIDFCRLLRADAESKNYTTAAILLAALPAEETVAAARDAGAHFVLAKPIVPAVLLDRIEWIARDTRQFVTSDTYRGPDRRFQNIPLPDDQPERREETLKLLATPEKALSQSEINALFN